MNEMPKNAYGYIIKEHSVTLLIDGCPYMVDDSHVNWRDIRETLRERPIPWERVHELVDVKRAVLQYMHGNVEINGNVVTYKGRAIDNYVTRKILAFMEVNEPFEPLVAFLDRLMENPSRRAVQELYGFLEHVGLPIDNEGYFYAYKAITSEWKDKHSGTVDNSIGAKPWMERNEVDDDAARGCSHGFHAGDLDYVKGFGSPGDHVVIVRINPADVVSVPNEDCRKLRCCTYEVIEEFKGVLPDLVYQPATFDPDPDEEDPDREDEDNDLENEDNDPDNY